MKPYVLILCANLKGNLGDYAILEAMLRALSTRYTGCEIRFFAHGNKCVDRERMDAFEQALDVVYSYLGGSPHFRRPWILRTFRKQLDRLGMGARMHAKAIRRCRDRLLRSRQFASELSGADAIYFAGGAQWGRGDLNLNMFAQLAAAAELNGNVFCFPFSVSEGVIECTGVAEFGRLFSKLSQPVPVRDVVSYERLKAAGVPVGLHCDCVFSLASQVHQARVAQSKKVYVALTSSGGLSPENLAAFLSDLRAGGFEPVLFSSCAVEDRPLYEATRSAHHVEVIYPHSWREAVSVLGSGAFVVTNRLHCMIFSALAGSAVVPVTNRSKAKGYFKDAGLPASLPDVSSVGEEAVRKLAESCNYARDCQKDYRERCHSRLSLLFDAFYEMSVKSR